MRNLRKDPAAELSLSVLVSIFQLQQLMGDAEYDIAKGERFVFCGLEGDVSGESLVFRR